jgi:hypothetical protein
MKHKHLDPPRYPKLTNPIEEIMKKNFEVTLSKIRVDVAKKLVTEIKKK